MNLHKTRQSLVVRAGLLGMAGALLITLAHAATLRPAGPSPQGGDGEYTWWRLERERRQEEIDEYLQRNQANWDSFRTAPLAIRQDALNFVGIQMIIFRLLTELFPEIWGPAGERMAQVGYGPDPWDPDTVMPLGTGYILSEDFPFPASGADVRVNYATFTCMGCHSGSVTVEDGSLQRMVGGANPTENYFVRIHKTVTDPRYTAQNFRDALNSKPPGWVYQDPAMAAQEVLERDLFNLPGGAEFFLRELKFISKKSTERIESTLGTYTYGKNVLHPPPLDILGMLDAFGANAASFVDPDELTPAQVQAALPPLPAPTDFPAVWRANQRPRFEWGDEVGTVVYRSVAASLSLTAGDPAAVNEANVLASSLFAEELPPAPYPFDVSRPMASRGRLVYEQACASCHEGGNTLLIHADETGTDPGRAMVFTDYQSEHLLVALREGCTELSECFQPDGQPFPDGEIFRNTHGYTALPLNGIWATAPYLHNGSVPTLYHLITGERPASFFRGTTTYDQDFVGFTWDRDTTETGRAFLYDTYLDGFANTGHVGPEFNGGIDWNEHPDMLWDLLEYLKTL